MVFYLKYRPQIIEELDTMLVRQNLETVLSSGRPPHAFLFTGPKGLGKTSAARIVAKSVNCPKGKGLACGKCEVCQSIAEGRNLDVLEIDAASNRGIDEIRELRERIKFSPTSARYKVYIIDEVHMLTSEAFNALLKTLEEPPPHAFFVLCTTEAHKLPQTITSRCQRFDFKRASKEDLVRSLERIVKGEKLQIEKEVLGEIAERADGSFRDATKILEQASFLGGEITLKQVREILGETENLKPEKLLEFLVKKDTQGAVLEINRLMEAGENLRVYIEGILNLLHETLMTKVGVGEENGEDELARLLEKDQIIRLVNLFSQAYEELKTAVIPQLPLELAVVEYCEENGGRALKSDFLDDVALAGPVADGRGLVFSPQREPALRSSSAIFSASDSLAMEQKIKPNLLVARKGSTQKSDDSLQGDPSGRAPRRITHDLFQLWPQIVEATKVYNHTLAGILRGCRPQNFDGKILTIETAYQFHKDKLGEPKIRDFLTKAVSQVLGEGAIFKCVLGKKGESD